MYTQPNRASKQIFPFSLKSTIAFQITTNFSTKALIKMVSENLKISSVADFEKMIRIVNG